MKILFIQLPVPQQNIGNKSGNLPLAAHYLKAGLEPLKHVTAEVVPEAIATWYGDLGLINYLVENKPDVLAFTLYCWNLERSLYILDKVREQLDFIALGGGPEVLPENALLVDSGFDYLIPGEGEKPLFDLLQNHILPRMNKPCWLPSQPADEILNKLDIPAMYAGIDPFCSQMLLVESQRGCPYKCGYCYYNKSRSGLYRFSDEDVVSIISTIPNEEEYAVYLLDPSLNTRTDLPGFLKKIAKSRQHHMYQTYGETRAESITPELARLYFKAGFTELEIGLQTSNKKTMKLMQRETKLMDFAAGCKALKNACVTPKVDLIIGLPGDDLDSVKRSIDFVARHKLYRDVQVFPLLLLHGTEFRARSAELGLHFMSEPPYQILSTPTLSGEDMFTAFNYAEKILHLHFNPLPELDLSETDILVHHADCIGKYHFHRMYTDLELTWLAARLASTVQFHFYPNLYEPEAIAHTLSILTAVNPFCVYEIVLWDRIVDTDMLLQNIHLKRPHYLDKDRQYLYPQPGNRSVTFTAVLRQKEKIFYGEMKRQIYNWENEYLPQPEHFAEIRQMDGIFMDEEIITGDIFSWYFEVYQELEFDFPLSFRTASSQVYFWLINGRQFNKQILTEGDE